ncbi:DUF4167 domain-containing protein [Tropicimonas sp. TH_r6]|uniref:DUF4167 domain-containing protein n=1 Tax=Tropicimonas sp. TH_r6 TaxID=3082085 RepID=UPI0029537F29|nr:DUF4167 domain-containing protein [Tropicimonas sp. TH_r6]MDV7143813.1 DUF4167 domain-containing protein [Tropicimonas sp. TH_r6]
MRSQKSRSRSKSNRQRSVGNIVNRVFDSSGPEGKVRGTPQQIIDKYNQLARDAALGNDRVAMENFQQHSEHYTRMLGEAQREQDARREQQEQQQRDRQRDRHDNNNQGGGQGGQPQPQSHSQPRPQQAEPEGLRSVEPIGSASDVIEDEIQSSPQPDLLIDTSPKSDSPAPQPETAPAAPAESKPKPRRARKPKPKTETPEAQGEEQAADPAPKPKRTRKPKAKPEPESSEQGGAAQVQTDGNDSPEAAE